MTREGAAAADPTTAEIAAEWAGWVRENLIAGAPPREVVEALVSEGLGGERARFEVSQAALEPATRIGRLAARRLELFGALRSRLDRVGSQRVARVATLDADAFYDGFYAANRPVLITDWVRRWPAFGRWSPESFAERFGEVEVSVSVGRDADPDYDINEEALARSMTMAEFVRRMRATGEGNDIYMIARNRNWERSELTALHEEIVVDPEIFDVSRLIGGSQLWMGPAGTVTPLHHDTSNILFCQVHGTKRVTLVPSWEVSLLGDARELYAGFDPEVTEQRGESVAMRTVIVEAGDALFIPVGWWHHVRALTASISWACVAFSRDNDFEWYRPASPREERF